MQQLVNLIFTGKINDQDPQPQIKLGNRWLSLEEASSPPHSVRIVQIIHHPQRQWLALIETLS